MKAKIKKGSEILFQIGNLNNIKDVVIINFMHRYTYISFKQKNNHLLINTTEGEVDIVFTGQAPVLKFESFCKDQLILTVV